MKTLDFCEECEVYHNLIFVSGRAGFIKCQKRIQEEFDQQIPRVKRDQVSSEKSTPNSKASYTSIQNHVSPKQIQLSKFKTQSSLLKKEPENKAHSFADQNSNKMRQLHFSNPEKTYVPQILVTQPKTPIHHQPTVTTNNNVPIPASSPHNKPHYHPPPSFQAYPPQRHSLQLKQTKPNIPRFSQQQHQPSFLSTIKQQGCDESDLSKSVYTNEYPSSANHSKRSSFQPPSSLQPDSIKPEKLLSIPECQGDNSPLEGCLQGKYKFKDLKKKYEIDLGANKKQEKFCWCW